MKYISARKSRSSFGMRSFNIIPVRKGGKHGGEIESLLSYINSRAGFLFEFELRVERAVKNIFAGGGKFNCVSWKGITVLERFLFAAASILFNGTVVFDGKETPVYLPHLFKG